MKIKNVILPVILVMLFSACAFASSWQDKRYISVAGEAEIKVVPDQIMVTFGVTNESRNLLTAKNENDAKVKAILEIVKKDGIDPKDIQTDYVSLNPKYKYDKENVLVGYIATKNIVVVLHDVSAYEKFLGDCVASGANYISNVEFKTSQLRKYRDLARASAIKAAKEKATAMAKELGQNVGQPLTISEESYPWYDNSKNGGLNAAQNSFSSGGEGEYENTTESENTLALGQIKVTARVTVVFELK